jgi:hypothetical protein
MENEPEKTEPNSSSLAVWRWPMVVLALGVMLLIAFLYSIKAAKDATLGTAKELTDTVKEIGEAAVTIAENFTQAKITETFEESLPEVKGTGEGNLEVATMKNVKTFKRTDKLTILWDTVSLGTTVTEIKVPATFRYHIRLSEPWKLEVREQNCIVIAPALRATTPVAIHTHEMEKRSDEGWARYNADEQLTALEKSLTPRLNGYARSEEHLNVVREHARKTVAEFVRQWLMKEDHWREDRFRTIHIIFADEAKAKDYPAKPTLELN